MVETAGSDQASRAARGAVLRRKTRPGQRMARSGGPAKPARLLRLALARVANDMMDLALTLDDPADQMLSMAELLDRVEERALVLLLTGPGEAPGLCIVSPGLMAGVIEWQTIRRIAPATPPPRAPTRTDASILSGWIDRVLAGLAAALPVDCTLHSDLPYRFGSFLADPRPLGHLLEDVPHRVFTAEITLDGGPRSGVLTLGFPVPDPALSAAGTAAGAAPGDWQATVERNVMGSETRLDAVLGRISMPLSQLVDLRVGARVPLSMAMVDQVRLEGADGRAIGTGRLGQSKGHRALRLHDPDAPPRAGATAPAQSALEAARPGAVPADRRASPPPNPEPDPPGG